MIVTMPPKLTAGITRDLMLIPLALITTISESPESRAYASMTPKRVERGKAISRKVGIRDKNTRAI